MGWGRVGGGRCMHAWIYTCLLLLLLLLRLALLGLLLLLLLLLLLGGLSLHLGCWCLLLRLVLSSRYGASVRGPRQREQARGGGG